MPVSDKKINERVARVNGAFTVFLLVLSGMTQNLVPVVFLAADFLLRTTDYPRFSLIAITSKGIVRYPVLNQNLINAGPKIFAARIGFILCVLIITSFALNAYITAIALAGIPGLFSFLEAAFGICIACEFYPYVYRLTERLSRKG